MMNEPTKPHTHTHIPNTRSPSPLKKNKTQKEKLPSKQTIRLVKQDRLFSSKKRPVQMTVISLQFTSVSLHFGFFFSVQFSATTSPGGRPAPP